MHKVPILLNLIGQIILIFAQLGGRLIPSGPHGLLRDLRNSAHQLVDQTLLWRLFVLVDPVALDGVLSEHTLLLALKKLSVIYCSILAAVLAEDESFLLITVTDFAFYNG